ncbi:MAG TPA: tRNA (N6-threonylcarbamoyladenosine(37)-N6)-methyltransferase TrmO [Dehalococcoidales bacterium]|nr:tRNA (N6-threonylcarbamoyladenosine(37)-N6)-methyltransferase TrmO [Dehalococcoidales bacterium]
MTESLPEITLKPIGAVRSEIKEPTRRDCKDVVSEIVVDSSLAEALDNLDEFSHIIILYWIHKSPHQAPVKVHPRGNPENKLMGVFATRSPDRPNPIGKSTVRLLERRGNILKVRGLDAIDGTPVLDIKPYIPGYDSVDNARAPSWMVKK